MSHEITLNDINMIMKINELLKSTSSKEREGWLNGKKILDIDTIIPEESLGDVLNFSQENLKRVFEIGEKRADKYV